MRRRRSSILQLALLAVLGWACSETVVGVVEVAVVAVQPGTASVLVGADVPLSVRLMDDRGNELAGRRVTWSSSSPQIATVTAQGVVRGVTAGQTDVTASSDGVQGSARVTVRPRPVLQITPDSLVFVTTPTVVPAPAPVQIDATGGSVSGLAITVGYDSGAAGWLGATLTSEATPAVLTVRADPSGLAPDTYRATLRVASAEAGNSPRTLSVRLDVAPNVPGQLTIAAGDGQTGIAGAVLPSPVGVRVNDTNGSPLAGVAVTFAVMAGGGSLASGAPVATNSSGIALAPAWTLGPVAGANRLRAVAAGLPGDTAIITATGVAGPAARLDITTQPSASAVSGVPFARQPVVQLRDVNGNAVSAAGVSVTVTLVVGGGTLSGTTVVTTDATGAARFSNLAITGTAGDKELRFASGSLTPAQSAPITITSGTGTRLGLVTQPSASAQSGVPFARQPEVQLQDAGGNAVTQAGVLITAAIETGGGTLNGTRTTTTDAAGIAHFTNLSISGTAGARTLRFTASGITSVVSGSITLTSGPASAAHSTASAPSGVAGNVTPITITLHDDGGNAVTGAAAQLAVTVRGANSATPQVSESGGGTYAASYTPTTIGTDSIFVTVGGTPLAGTPLTSVVAPAGVSATQSSAVASPTTGVIADGQATSTITIDLRDPLNNPVSALATSISVGLTGSASAGPVVESSVPGTYRFGITSTVANVVSIALTVGSTTLSDHPSVEFVPGVIATGSSNTSASPATGVTADATAASTVTITLADAFNNPIPGLTDADFAVTLTGSAQRSTVTGSGPPGTYVFTVTNTVAETITVTVVAAGVQLTGQPTIQFTPGAVSASLSTAAANPTSGVTADGAAASTVTVVLVDAFANPISGVTSFSVGLTGNAHAGAVSETATPGTYTFTVTDTDAEVVTVTVTANGVQLSQQPTIGFVAGPVSASASTAAANPATGVAADGSTVSTVTVTLVDANANAIMGLAAGDFTIGLTGSAQQTSAVAETGTPGTYSFTVVNTVIETITVTITASGIQLLQQPTIQFVVGSISPTLSTVIANPAVTVPADGSSASVVTVALVDAGGNVITGVNPTNFAITLTGSAVATTPAETGTPGIYTFSVTNTVEETVTVTVKVRGVTLAQQPTIQFGP